MRIKYHVLLQPIKLSCCTQKTNRPNTICYMHEIVCTQVCIMGVNVSHDFIRLASSFLNCRVGSILFKYLGLPIGANPRRMSTWEPLLISLRKRLTSWSNKYVSLEGRIVFLNSVLNDIPIFYLSFVKILI
jgi:hypothetical protein